MCKLSSYCRLPCTSTNHMAACNTPVPSACTDCFILPADWWKYIWLANFRCKPCPHIWTWSAKPSHLSTIFRGTSTVKPIIQRFGMPYSCGNLALLRRALTSDIFALCFAMGCSWVTVEDQWCIKLQSVTPFHHTINQMSQRWYFWVTLVMLLHPNCYISASQWWFCVMVVMVFVTVVMVLYHSCDCFAPF